MGGIWIGKVSPDSMGFVSTYAYQSSTRKNYYLDDYFELRTALHDVRRESMFGSAPELLAFWSEDD